MSECISVLGEDIFRATCCIGRLPWYRRRCSFNGSNYFHRSAAEVASRPWSALPGGSILPRVGRHRRHPDPTFIQRKRGHGQRVSLHTTLAPLLPLFHRQGRWRQRRRGWDADQNRSSPRVVGGRTCGVKYGSTRMRRSASALRGAVKRSAIRKRGDVNPWTLEWTSRIG